MTSEHPCPRPTGRREERDGVGHVVYTRTFRAPITAVWAAVTEPERIERWIGTWTGDPAAGSVDFRMTAEGDDVPTERYLIEVCQPPHTLLVSSEQEMHGLVWRLRLDLAETDGVTTLTFDQVMDDPELVASVGPGWDYYLDRLVAAETGADVAAVVWSDYESGSAHYRDLFS